MHFTLVRHSKRLLFSCVLGWVVKRGNGWKSWNRRYMRLESRDQGTTNWSPQVMGEVVNKNFGVLRLAYYTDMTVTSLKGEIILSEVDDVTDIDVKTGHPSFSLLKEALHLRRGSIECTKNDISGDKGNSLEEVRHQSNRSVEKKNVSRATSLKKDEYEETSVGLLESKTSRFIEEESMAKDSTLKQTAVSSTYGVPTTRQEAGVLDVQESGVSTKTTRSSPSPSQEGGPTRTTMTRNVGERVNYEYLVKDILLGQGAFGAVYTGKYYDQQVAIKEILPGVKLSDEALKEFREEAKLHFNLRHKNIVDLLCFNSDASEAGDPICMVMDRLTCSVHDILIKKDSEFYEKIVPLDRKLRMLEDAANGLMFLHSNGILHLDVKSMNMLVAEDGTIKIADFGLSKVKEETDQQDDGAMSAGSMPWMAPELMGDSNPSPKADIFSFYVLTVCEIFFPFFTFSI